MYVTKAFRGRVSLPVTRCNCSAKKSLVLSLHFKTNGLADVDDAVGCRHNSHFRFAAAAEPGCLRPPLSGPRLGELDSSPEPGPACAPASASSDG